MYHKPPTVIIDAGSAYFKYGLDMDEKPNVFPTIVAKVRDLANLPMSKKRYYVGRDALNAMDCFMTSPIVKRTVVNWDDMENIWSFTFQEALQLKEYRDRNVLLAQPTLTSSANTAKTLQYMFEKYKFGGVYIEDASLLAMRFAKQSMGVVIDSGEQLTQVVPIHEGRIGEKMVQTLELGGKDITKYLTILLAKEIGKLKSFNKDKVREIKECMCKVALDYKIESKDKAKLIANYPVGPNPKDDIRFNVERIKCTELMFEPKLDVRRKKTDRGVSEMVFDAVQKHDGPLQKQLYQNLVLVGGNTLFQGMRARLKRDLLKLHKAKGLSTVEVRFATPEVTKHDYPTWQGALLVVNSPEQLKKSLVTKANYMEYGVSKLSKSINKNFVYTVP